MESETDLPRHLRGLGENYEWDLKDRALHDAAADIERLTRERDIAEAQHAAAKLRAAGAEAALVAAREFHEKELRRAFLFGCSVWNGASNAEEAARDQEVEEQAWQEFRATLAAFPAASETDNGK